jgi:hypothetical protein
MLLGIFPYPPTPNEKSPPQKNSNLKKPKGKKRKKIVHKVVKGPKMFPFTIIKLITLIIGKFGMVYVYIYKEI